MTRAAIYARFSSDRQSECSIEDQVRLCRERAEALGLTVVDVYADYAISGAAAINRPSLQRLLTDAKAGRFSVVLSEALDRLSRNQRDTADIHERLAFHGVRILTLSEGDVNELHVGLKGTMNALFLKDLAAKTSRGMRGNAEAGFSTGGRVYGYRALRAINPDGTPQKVRWDIDKAQADIVRRIFEEYVAGASARDIAARLNTEGVPSPQGGIWHASTISGSRARASGILNNPLYNGRQPYNRQSFVKDPATGRRVARINPESEWRWFPRPELRIIPDALWQATRAAKAASPASGVSARRVAAKQRIFTGLMRCGVCGGRMAVVGHTRHGHGRIGCVRRREAGACTNTKTITAHRLEARILAGLKERLLAPHLVEAAAKAYQRERQRLAATAADRSAAIERRLTEIRRGIDGLTKAIADGLYSPTVKGQLEALERERESLEADLAAMERPSVVRFHPGIADRYRELIAQMESGLLENEADAQAKAIIRSLVERVTIHPREGMGEIDIELVASLAMLMPGAEQAARGVPFGPERAPATIQTAHLLDPAIFTFWL